MVFGKRGGEKDRSVIVYNANLTLSGIPSEAYDYVDNGKSAIDHGALRHQHPQGKRHPERPNDWSDDPRYIMDLLKRVVRVSLKTVRIVSGQPPLNKQP